MEFGRILRPDGKACIMVYNRNSAWFHLYVAYDRVILQNALPGKSIDEVFAKSTDGSECPVSRCYRPDEFLEMCMQAGFQSEFEGGYLSKHELKVLEKLCELALADPSLAVEHKQFLMEVTRDDRGYPRFCGKYAGIDGVYKLYKTLK